MCHRISGRSYIFGICNISYEQWNTKDSIWWCRVKSNYDYWLSYPSLVMLILFVLLYFLNIGDLLCAVIGMFSMKVAAYLQPFTDKLITKKEGEKVGSSYVNTLVACDSSFMIQSLKEFHIPGIDYTLVLTRHTLLCCWFQSS